MKKLVYALIFVLLVSLAQAATIKGTVMDSLDNLVAGAELKADCLEGKIFITDKFGSFLMGNLPEGKCRVYANFKDGVGFKDIIIENGTMDLEIKLDKTIVNISRDKDNLFLVVVLIILAVLISLIFLYFKLLKKEKKLEKQELKEEKEIKELKQKRVKDIFPTLNSKEKKVVEFLLTNKHQSSQATIRHNTGISRTSLARCLKGLEAKKIISIEKIGKLVKIKLTDWFLEKE